jgi:A1 cistron-splicing factor AAR2
MGIPIRHAYIRVLEPRQRIVLTFDPATENVSDVEGVISDDHLKTLDKELAPYPFDGLAQWKSLTEGVDQEILDRVVSNNRMDGMTSAAGEETERGEQELNKDEEREGRLRFTSFHLKRSWRDGAIGEEVTQFARDKSWLFGHVVKGELGGSELCRLQ